MDTNPHAPIDQAGKPAKNPMRTPSPVGGSLIGLGAAAPGIVVLGFILFFATIGVLLAAAIFPIGGGITIGAYLLFYNVFFLNFMKNTQEIAAISMFLIPGCLIFVVAMIFENWLARFRPYRWLRVVWRMLTIMILTWMITATITGSLNVPETASIAERVPWPERIAMIAGLVGGFFFSRFLDRNIRNHEGPIRISLPWRKKKREAPPLPWHTPKAQ